MKSLEQILQDKPLNRLLLQAYQCFLLNTDAMIFIKDANGIYQSANMPFVRLVGKERVEEIIGYSDFEVFEDRELAERYVADDHRLIRSGKDEISFNEPLPAENGRPRYGRTSKYVLREPDGTIIGLAGISRDITPEIVVVEQDEMTGLLSRASLKEYVGNFLSGPGQGHTHGLFMLDLDNFKKVNDTYGHRAGDRFLAHIAGVIAGCFRDSDLVGRVGGDEFVVLMKHVPNREAVYQKGQQLLEAIHAACAEVEDLKVSASIGIGMYPEDGTTPEELYDRADKAMYCAKHSGKNRVALAGEQMPREVNA